MEIGCRNRSHPVVVKPGEGNINATDNRLCKRPTGETDLADLCIRLGQMLDGM